MQFGVLYNPAQVKGESGFPSCMCIFRFPCWKPCTNAKGFSGCNRCITSGDYYNCFATNQFKNFCEENNSMDYDIKNMKVDIDALKDAIRNINDAFVWKNTPETDRYWGEVYAKLNEIMKQAGQKKEVHYE